MSSLDDDMMELDDALQAARAEDCGCHGSSENADAFAGGDDAALAELDQLLGGGGLSAEDELEFALLEGEEGLPSLESVLAIAQHYPGLRITFSFGQEGG